MNSWQYKIERRDGRPVLTIRALYEKEDGRVEAVGLISIPITENTAPFIREMALNLMKVIGENEGN